MMSGYTPSQVNGMSYIFIIIIMHYNVFDLCMYISKYLYDFLRNLI